MARNSVATAVVLTAGALESGLVAAGGYGAALLLPELLVNSWNSPDGMNATNLIAGGVLALGWPLAIVLGGLLLRAVARRHPFLASFLVLLALVPVLLVCIIVLMGPPPGIPAPTGAWFAVIAVVVCAAAGALVGIGVDNLLNRRPRPSVGPPTATSL